MRVQRATHIPELERLCRLAERRNLRVELHAQDKELTVLRVSDGRGLVRVARVYCGSVRGASRRLLSELG